MNMLGRSAVCPAIRSTRAAMAVLKGLAGALSSGAVGVTHGVAQERAPSVGCQVSDSNVVLDLHLPLSRDGSGNAARGMRGSLDIHHQKLAKDRRNWPLDDKLPAQFWNWGNELKIRLLLGTGEKLLDFVIDAKQVQGGPYSGSFRLEAAEGVKVVGRITCTVG